nr:DNA polymerase III [Rhodomonas sp. NIES-698]
MYYLLNTKSNTFMKQFYTPLHIKYRSQTFQQLIGQKETADYFELLLEKRKISSIYLFVGHHGSGKTTLASSSSKTLNCSNSKKNPCYECTNCKKVHLVNLKRDKNTETIKIFGNMKKEKKNPIKNNYRVIIIDVDSFFINKALFSNLVSTLECPHNKTIFIFSTTSIDKIPKSIHSRGHVFYFKPIVDKDLSIFITKVVQNENLKITNRALLYILKKAKGDFKYVLNVIELFSIKKQNLTSKTLDEHYSIFLIDQFNKKIRYLSLFKLLVYFKYISLHNLNEQKLLKFMYFYLLNSIAQKALNNRVSIVFVSIKEILLLLKKVDFFKYKSKTNYWLNLIIFILLSDVNNIFLNNYKKQYLYIRKNRIHSN